MQKYTDGKEFRYFEDDINVEDWIDLTEFRLMTEAEILKHETPKSTEFHTLWNGSEWLDSRTPEEIDEYNRALMPRLTKRQFALQLNSVQVGEATLYKQMLALIAQDETAQIEWDTVAYIERLSPTVLAMTVALGLTDEQVDEIWREAFMR